MRVVVLIMILLGLAWANSFVQDDAFISFRYAQHLTDGDGLTWNPGDRVEGYTNFLWTLILAVPIGLGLDPVGSSKALGLMFFAGTLVVTYRFACSVLTSRRDALLVLGLLGTNYTFSAYATGGLETQMQTFLIVGCIYLAFSLIRGQADTYRIAALSVFCGAALLTRLDSAVPVSVALALVLRHLLTSANVAGRRAAAITALVGPVALLVGPWLIWKYGYYGALLPNSFHAKAGSVSAESLRFGALYVYEFLQSYLLLFPVLLAMVRWRSLVRNRETCLLTALVGLWCLYVIAVGGDFMEFRFLVPVLPFGFLLLVAVARSVKDSRVLVAMVLLVLLGSLRHGLFFGGARWIESVRGLEAKLVDEGDDWIGVGKRLHDLFGEQDPEIVIATTAAGAIPYYSGLKTIDMLGVNDRWIARHGTRLGHKPGHQRIATLDYLLRRGVHLVLGHPQVELPDAPESTNDLARFGLRDAPDDLVPDAARLLEIPLDRGRRILVLYLRPSEAVDQAILRQGLKTHRLSRVR